MAETLIISSPSHALNHPEPVPPIPTPVDTQARTPQPASKNAPKAAEGAAVTKRKQSKSRNGTLSISLLHYVNLPS
jgi:hypothetical protein